MLRKISRLLALAARGVTAVRSRDRWRRLSSDYRELELYADTLLQHGQGTILNIQGIINELAESHPVRHRIEQALTRAELQLTELREKMQLRCSEQQRDWMR